ncbi:hypothetical protein DMN91_012949 [Ooceraea biroi]|uniref:Mucin-5AC n=1 Tax=Ooceraea biroi TaxID=2015173 RepID=A0A026VUA2_OOCBI|nr:uncharacterized protein LOC105286631 [Ooceraea biroi]EZA47317.1 hypothetical protein X777_16356 [Ooceraea biroi]RLU15062.1 hypothetical protein DMN91_012949 [Ooceraea biroi]
MRRRLWILFAVLACVSGEYLMGGHLDNNAGSKTRSGTIGDSSALGRKTHPDGLDLDLTAEESTVAAVAVAAGVDAAAATTSSISTDDGDVPRYHIPYPFAFNGGKPFSLEKDPITGKIDFEKAPPVRALNYTGDYRDRGNQGNGGDDLDEEDGDKEDATPEKANGKDNDDVGPNEINAYTPNFHDFLNLPVHYSSDKYGNDNYPLISSSYANTKVQSGANSYSTYNHRPYHPGNELYVRPTKISSHIPITKTSTYRTTTIADFVKAKWTSSTTSTTSAPSSTASSSRSTPTVSTKAPVVTTWKPSSTPLVFHSIDRTGVDVENEKNLLPIEKLHASGHAGFQRNPSTSILPPRTPNDGDTTETIPATRYKDQSSLNNFVLSHDVRHETKPSAQSEEYKDSYDAYESPDSEEEGESDDKDDDYFSPFRDLLKEDVTSSTPSTTTPATTTSTTTPTTTTTTTTVATPSAGATTPTVTASSSALPALQGDVFKETYSIDPLQFPMMQQRPVAPSPSLNSDRIQSVATAERYDGMISHGYRPGPIIRPPDRMGTGTVIESTSNIVIPPDQDTVSFVLGNRQNVDGDYYSVGTTIGENPYGSSSDVDASFWSLGHGDPHGPTKEINHQHPPVSSITELSPNRVTQKWWSSSSSVLKSDNNELDPMRAQNAFIATTAANPNMKNQSKERDPGYVAFPDGEAKDAMAEEHIIIINEADGNIHELPPKTVLTTTTTNKTINLTAANDDGDLPQLAEDLMPPAESSRPPSYYYHYQFDTLRPDHSRPQRLPLPPPPPPPPPSSRVKPHSVPPLDAGLRKRPYSPDTKLPNILPQFRPNAKASHGHRGPDVIGTMPAGQGPPARIRQPSLHSSSRRPPLPPPPSYLQRLNPPPPPIHAVRLAFVPTSKTDSVTLPHEIEPTIRRFRPPHVSPISRGGPGGDEGAPSNRLFGHEESKGDREVIERKEDRGKIEITGDREVEGSERYPEEPPMTPPRPPLFPKRRTADPPRVTTLQMIQHHGELTGENEAEPEVDVLAQAERRKSDNHDPTEVTNEQPPVYVVYPVNSAVNIHSDDSNERDGSVVVGIRGPHRPLPPDTLLQDEGESAHTVYNGRPVAPDFPYPLERPDPSSIFSAAAGVKETPLLVPSEQRQQQASYAAANDRDNERNEQDAAMNVIPYLQDFLPYRKRNDAAISVTLHRAPPTSTAASTPVASTPTPTPIAYVYTPTRAAHLAHRFDDDEIDDDDDNDANASGDATATVLLPSQQPSSSSSSAPAPQNFMAPFVASLSAEAPSKNGWSVVVVDPPVDTEKRTANSDSGDAKLANSMSEVDVQTEKNEFDADNFKPQLFGGFKPIYEFPTEEMERDINTADIDTAEMNTPRRSTKMLVSVPNEE